MEAVEDVEMLEECTRCGGEFLRRVTLHVDEAAPSSFYVAECPNCGKTHRVTNDEEVTVALLLHRIDELVAERDALLAATASK